METTLSTSPNWPFINKLAFRFIFAYIILYAFPFPINYFPFIGEFVQESISHIWEPLVIGFGKYFFSLEINAHPSGSGDTLYDYMQAAFFVVLALSTALIWSIIDRKRGNYDKLYFYLEIFVRYFLAAMLIGYGFAKIFKLQFSMPGPYSLIKPLGEMSPMGLAWTFMGFSEGFNLFTGIGEALGGFLLFFRRTKVLGGFLSIAVMSNVVAMNFFYDIPVKLFSSHLLFFIFFILWSDFQRIINFLILNKTVEPKKIMAAFSDTKFRIPSLIIKVLFIGSLLFNEVTGSLESIKEYGDKASKPPLYGIYEVEQFTLNNNIIPALETDSVRWKNMLIQWEGTTAIEIMNKDKRYLGLKADTTKQTLHFYSWRDSLNKNGTFEYAQVGTDSLSLKGIWQTDTLDILMKYQDPADFPLLTRGFHWISEYPYNR